MVYNIYYNEKTSLYDYKPATQHPTMKKVSGSEKIMKDLDAEICKEVKRRFQKILKEKEDGRTEQVRVASG